MSQRQSYDSLKADRLWERYRKHRDIETRNELVIANESLVGRVLNHYFANYSEDVREDLRQEGLRGLTRAVELFKPELGNQFSTYAYLSIMRFINNWLQRSNQLIRLPSGVNLRISKIEIGKKAFFAQTGRPHASDRELASFLSITEEEVAKTNGHLRLLHISELDRPVGKNGKALMNYLPESAESSNPLEILSRSGAIDFDPVITTAREVLSKRDYKILLMSFDGVTQSKIAQDLNMTRQRVRQAIERSLVKLRLHFRVPNPP